MAFSDPSHPCHYGIRTAQFQIYIANILISEYPEPARRTPMTSFITPAVVEFERATSINPSMNRIIEPIINPTPVTLAALATARPMITRICYALLSRMS
jgi:hypothetical protein